MIYSKSDVVDSVSIAQNIRGIQISVDGKPLNANKPMPTTPKITFKEWFLKTKEHNDIFYPDDCEYYYQYIGSDLVDGYIPPPQMVVVKIKK